MEETPKLDITAAVVKGGLLNGVPVPTSGTSVSEVIEEILNVAKERLTGE